MTRRMRKFFLAVWIGVTALQIAGAPASASEFSAPQVKAAFLYHFAQFVDWPAGSFGTDHSPLILGLLGRDSTGTAALQTLSGKTVKGRPLEVRPVSGIEEAKKCHLLFVSSSELPRLPQILDALRGGAILTVSEIDHFADQGGIIGLVTVDHKIRFEINAAAARGAGLIISSQMLKLAAALRPSEERKEP